MNYLLTLICVCTTSEKGHAQSPEQPQLSEFLVETNGSSWRRTRKCVFGYALPQLVEIHPDTED